MAFWDLRALRLEEFRPGVRSKAEIGKNLILAVMEIGPGKADTGHEHPHDQCGVVLGGKIEMFVGEEKKILSEGEAYFLPAGVRHGWRTLEDSPARILDVSLKPSG